MSKSTKLLLGFLTFFPLVFIPFFVITVLTSPGGMDLSNELYYPGALFGRFGVIIVGLMIVYIISIFRNPALKNNRALWIFLIILGSIITMPIYWYRYIWMSGKR